MDNFRFTELLPRAPHGAKMRRLSAEGVHLSGEGAAAALEIDPGVLEALAYEAFKEINFFLRPDHLAQLRKILDDPEASANDKYVALDLLKNANVASGGVLPMCQDTGTAIIYAKRGHRVLTDGTDAEQLSRGIYNAYKDLNLRYSQLSPTTLWDEVNTRSNLPAEIDISLGQGPSYELLFMAKGGGSANKSFLYQETKSILDEERMLAFLREKIESIGTAACPPYHLAVVIGGTSAEFAMKTAKLASTHYLDTMPTTGSAEGHGYRDVDFEAKVLDLTTKIGFGAQFGGKYFCHDVRVIRLPRHAGSLPIAIAVSCSADRQVFATINADGVFIEELEHDPARFIPETGLDAITDESAAVSIDLGRPMAEIRSQLSECSVGTRVSLTGKMVVARDVAHAKFRQRLEAGEGLPQYLLDHPVYYAGPAKTPEGMATGSFGPTTAGRMDGYVEALQAAGGSLVMLAKGNRAPAVAQSCKAHGGFYLGSVGGPAARLAQDNIRSIEVIDYAELGMEAVFLIEVENFPAFVIVDDKGNDFFNLHASKPLNLGPTRLLP
ncbi:fumarate hydratase [Alpinimonas psychrophila]|uniref:Fumarate hydratase class I n=1 Tax=Alpinimonas psychrophila TaxID=748908 RepID=A0A7W3JV95_9MICO|nr:FumA C-terminus/TtdB family hydratase beta subunit [Alpinimonas psychrophila]MBA8829866.1 fumarate hydratase class I [Alpinimonas psychrophila]